MGSKRTLVIGASEKTSRYSNMAVNLLTDYGHEVYAYGLRKGFINKIEIHTNWPDNIEFDTVTMYVGPQNQSVYIDKIIGLMPNRVIFNPGTENEEFRLKLLENNIEVVENCTLVMLRSELF